MHQLNIRVEQLTYGFSTYITTAVPTTETPHEDDQDKQIYR